MLGFLKKKTEGEVYELEVGGMHCSSCALNITSEIEETEGVIDAKTSYATGRAKITITPKSNALTDVTKKITDLGYTVKKTTPKSK